MDDFEAEGRDVYGMDEFTASVRSPIREHGEVVGVVAHDWTDVGVRVNGMWYPPRMIASLIETDTRPAVAYVVQFHNHKEVFYCTELTIQKSADDGGIRTIDVKALSPDALVQLALDAVVMPTEGLPGGAWNGTMRPLTTPERRRHERQQPTHGRPRLTPEHYERVAKLHKRLGRVADVADELGVPFSTAARWVREARKRGLIK